LETTLTSEKDFKRLVRFRAAKTGESYALARTRLRYSARGGVEMDQSAFRRVEKTDLGFAVHVPDDWPEFPPQPTNSPFEVARFHYRDGERHVCLIFRHPGSSGLDPHVPAQEERTILDRKGFEHFSFEDLEISGRPAVRMDFDRADLPIGMWWAREYFVVARNLVYILGVGSTDIDGDQDLFNQMATRFEVL
jgi:hypothetical protein